MILGGIVCVVSLSVLLLRDYFWQTCGERKGESSLLITHCVVIKYWSWPSKMLSWGCGRRDLARVKRGDRPSTPVCLWSQKMGPGEDI